MQWHEQPLDGGRWVAALRVAERDGKPVVAEVRVFPGSKAPRSPGTWSESPTDVPGGGVRQRGVLRSIRLDAIVGIPGSADGPPAEVTAQRTGGGRPRLTNAVLASTAADYVEAVEAGSSAPVRDAAVAGGVSVSTVRERVKRARRAGILGNTISGVAGGRLTPLALSILSGVENDARDSTEAPA